MTTTGESRQRRPWFWERALRETARMCRLCHWKMFAWHDQAGGHWEMCSRCDKP